MDSIGKYQEIATTYAMDIGIKILAAIVFWILGRWLIGLAVRFVQRALERQKVDPTVLRYVASIIRVTLDILLVIGILGYFGIQTTTFAALFAAAGVAIGMAWSGLLSNFAAGAFIIVLRPYKVGDFVTAAGITGTIKDIGLFTTTVTTPDNIHTILGNGKVFGDTIQNFSVNPYRRVELKAQLAGSVNHVEAMQLLRDKLATIPNVVKTPPVEVEILEFNLVGPVLAVRPFCHTDHYWQVYFDGNRMIRETIIAAGYPAPTPAQIVVVQQK